MASNRQKHLAFATKFGKFLHIKGKGLIHHHGIHERFKRMTLLGSGTVSYKHSPALNGGSIKHHNRPYQLKESAKVEHKQHRHFAPIHFKL